MQVSWLEPAHLVHSQPKAVQQFNPDRRHGDRCVWFSGLLGSVIKSVHQGKGGDTIRLHKSQLMVRFHAGFGFAR